MSSMNFDITARDSASTEFAAFATQVERLERKLRDLDGMDVEPKVRLDTRPAAREVTRFATELKTKIGRAIRDVPALDVDTVRAQARVASLAARLAALRAPDLTVEVRTGRAAQDLSEVRRELGQLRDTRIKLDIQTGTARAEVSAIAQALRQLRDINVQIDVRTGSSEARVTTLHGKMLALKALSPIRLEVQVDDQASAQLAAIRALATELSQARPDIQVTADTAAALAQLTALRAQLGQLGAGTTTVRVQLDSLTFLGQLARIQTELSTLAGGTIEIDADTRQMMEALAAARVELAALSQMEASPTVDADISLAQFRIRTLEQELARIAGRQYTANIDVDRDGSSVRKIVAIVAALGFATAALGSATAATASLGGSLVAAAGAAGLVPAALAGIGAAVAVVKIGTSGIADTFDALAVAQTSSGAAGDAAAAKALEAYNKLSPAAREYVDAVQSLKPAWDGVRLDVQQSLLQGIGRDLTELSSAQLPGVQAGLVGIAGGFNAGARSAIDFLSSGRAVDDVRAILDSTGRSSGLMASTLRPISGMFLDISAVGAPILEELAAGFAVSTDRAAAFIAEARRTGELEQWIRGGLTTLAEFGNVAGNVGGILVSVFAAAEASGADFLGTVVRVTGEVENFLRSTEGQNAMAAFFTESREAIDSVLPGLATLGTAGAEAVRQFSDTDGLNRFGGSLSDIADTAGPLIPTLGELAGGTLGALAGGLSAAAALAAPLVDGISGIVDATGPVAPLVAAAVIAFVGLGAARAAVLGLAASMQAGALMAGTYALGLTGSAAAGAAAQAGVSRLAGVVGGLGRALPIAGVALIGLGFLMEEFGSKADTTAAKVLQGSKTFEQAIAAEVEQLRKGTISFNESASAQAAEAIARRTVTEEIDKQLAALGPLERLQAEVAIAQGRYTDAVVAFGVASPQARAAQEALSLAVDAAERGQTDAAAATQSHTDRLLEQQRAIFAANDADLQYADSLARIAEAQDRAAEAARNHGAGSRELEAANRDVLRANLDTAAAAGVKAEADAKATGASNAAEIGARAQKDELNRLAQQATGPTRDALLAMANGSDLAARSASTSEIQARLQKDELGRLAAQATGPLRAAMDDARGRFDTLGGASASAEQRARMQKDELLRLAQMAAGPLRAELQRMADQIRTLPDGDFVVTAGGRLGPITTDGRVLAPGGGFQRAATGGILGRPSPTGIPVRRFADAGIMPGYTPGRDVHRFVSPTGGVLELSGGEPVMRPEFGAAVGHGWVHAANAAARKGGVAGVQSFLGRTLPRDAAGDAAEFASGGIYRRPPVERFVLGGIRRTGLQPFARASEDDYFATREAMAAVLTARMMAAVRAEEARRNAAASAAAAGGGPLGGGSGSGWQWQMNVLRAAFPGLALISGYRPGAITATGNPSYHGRGRAVDIPPRMDVFNWIRGNYGQKTKELIFSPANGAQVHNGSPHMYTGVTRSMHFDHVHWAMRHGGVMPSTLADSGATRARVFDRGGILRHREAAINLSGSPERVLTGRQTRDYDAQVGLRGRRVDMASEMRRSADAARASVVGSVGPRVDVGLMVAAVERLRVDLRAQVRQEVHNWTVNNPITETPTATAARELRSKSIAGAW